MGSSEGEAIAAPDAGGAGGSRAQQGGDAGSAVLVTRGVCCGTSNSKSSSSRLGRRRERQLESVCLIGQGSAALVYLVRCKVTGRMSALKVQRKADHARSVPRVQMEREVMTDARHALVAPLHAAFQDRLYLYLDMEYCPGGSLDNFVRYCVKRNLTEDEARFYAAEITLGLEFLHSKGYVYRDLKAANVLVAASGHIKLTDFGIAERGKVRIETDDKMVSPPRSLPRTKSSPGLAEVSLAPAPPQPGGRHLRRQTLGNKGPSANSAPPGQPGAVGVPPRAHAFSRKGLSAGGVASTAVGSPRDVEAVSTSEFPIGTREPDSCRSTFFRRKQCPKATPAATAGETPPRPPGLGARMRVKLRRGSRGSVSAGSIADVSSLTGSSSSSSVAVAAHNGGGGGGGNLGMPPPSPGRSRMFPGDSQRKQDTKATGLPPPGPEEALPRERCTSPPSTHGTPPATRQTTVMLAEASWGLLSGSPEYMAPEVLMHDPQGSAVDWWGLGILTYELLMGTTPFAGKNGKTRYTYLNIMHKEAKFPEPGERQEGDISGGCQDFINALLTKDPRGRAGSRGAHAVKAHPFLAEVSWARLLEEDAPLVPHCVHPPSVDNTSGWWWDLEDAISADEEHACDGDSGRGSTGAWWPFDRFDWSDDAEAGGRIPGPVGSSRKLSKCRMSGHVIRNGRDVAPAPTSGAFEARRNEVY